MTTAIAALKAPAPTAATTNAGTGTVSGAEPETVSQAAGAGA